MPIASTLISQLGNILEWNRKAAKIANQFETNIAKIPTEFEADPCPVSSAIDLTRFKKISRYAILGLQQVIRPNNQEPAHGKSEFMCVPRLRPILRLLGCRSQGRKMLLRQRLFLCGLQLRSYVRLPDNSLADFRRQT